LVWFKIMINFKDETQNLPKFTHFEKFIFIQQWFTQNMWSIGAIICIFNNKLQKISFKTSFIWKMKNDWNDSQSFCKVILLVPIYMLAPKWFHLLWTLSRLQLFPKVEGKIHELLTFDLAQMKWIIWKQCIQ
jgi:hypothetical protein